MACLHNYDDKNLLFSVLREFRLQPPAEGGEVPAKRPQRNFSPAWTIKRLCFRAHNLAIAPPLWELSRPGQRPEGNQRPAADWMNAARSFFRAACADGRMYIMCPPW